ncbi:MAG: InlB B-repeat-containing protein [Clostridia bacterium]|nr:InlB B-repeat-containing protein [Clostridia bacterium]
MTTKTKYLVIALLLLVLVTTSVGLSTWNIHYQAVIGDIAYDTSTKSSILNNYVYFGATDDANRAQANIKQNGSALYTYPIGYNTNSDGSVVFDGENYSTKTDNLFTYTYQSGKEYSPSVFVPSETAIKGDLNHPANLFLDKGALDIGWGIEDVFRDKIEREDQIEWKYQIEWEYQYRLASVPFDTSNLEEDYKGNSDNYCEVNAVYYAEKQITVYLSWENGNGNHQGDGIRVDFVVDENGNGSFTIRDKNNKVLTAQEAKLELNSTTDFITIGVKGFKEYKFRRQNCGWTTDIPTETGVWECRIIAKPADEYEYIIDKDANLRTDKEKILVEAIDLLNSNTENDVDYATQVTYAVMPAPVSRQNTVTGYNKGTEKLQAKRSGTTRGTMPLAEESQQTQEAADEYVFTLGTGDAAISGTSFVYKGQGYNIEIRADFQPTEGADVISINYAEDQENDAKDLYSHEDITSIDDHVYSTYGFSSDPNYIVTNPAVHYTIIKQEVKLTGWSGLETTYNGEEQEVEPILENTHGEVTFSVSYLHQSSGGNKAKNAGIYTVTASLDDAVEGSGHSSNFFLVNYASNGNSTEKTDLTATFTINKAPLTVTAKNVDVIYGNEITYESTCTGFVKDEGVGNLAGKIEYDSGYERYDDISNWNDTGNKGVYTIVASGYKDKDKEGNTIYADDGTHNYTFTYVAGKLTVEKAKITVSVDDYIDTYDGAQHDFSATATTVNSQQITVTFYKGTSAEGDPVTSVMNVADSGTYNYKVTALNHYDATGTFTVEITPASVKVVVDDQEITYGDAAPQYTVNYTGLFGSDPLGTTPLCEYKQGDNAGTYTIYLSEKTNGNYVISNDSKTTATLTVKKATVSTPAIPSKEYNGELQTADVPVRSYYTVIENNGGTNIGTYNVKLRLVDSANTKWASTPNADITLSFSITKITTIISDLKLVGWTYGQYDQEANSPTATINHNTAITYTYSKDGVTYTSAVPSEPGPYYVKASVDETENYTADEEIKTFEISRIVVTKPAEDEEKYVYDGTEKTYSLQTSTLYTITSDGLTQINAGTYPITIALNDTVHYQWNDYSDAALVYNFVIEKASIANATITLGNADNLVYNASEHTVTITGVYVNGKALSSSDYTVETSLTQTNAGNHAVTIKGQGNYTDTAKTTFTIAKLTISRPEANSTPFVYNGTEQTYTIVENAAYTITGNKQTNAGEHLVTVAFVSTNYQWNDGTTEAITFTFSIAKVKLTITVKDVTVNYGDPIPTYTVTYDGFVNGEDQSVLTGTLAFDCIYAQGTTVGTDCSINASGLTSNNYNIAYVSGSVTIKQLVISLDETLLEYKYGDTGATEIITNAQNNVNISYGSIGNVISITYTDGITTSSNSKISVGNTYRIDYKLLDTTNYTWATTKENTCSCYYKYKTALLNGEYYTIEDAIVKTNTTAGHIVLAKGSSSFTGLTSYYEGNGEFTLASESSIFVPHKDGASYLGSNTEGKVFDVGEDKTEELYSILTIPNGIHLTVEGSLGIGGYILSGGIVTRRGVIMNEGTISVDGNLHSIGFLKSATGQGQVYVNEGATALDVFVSYDYKGGRNTLGICNMDDTTLFPFNAYSLHNISCTTYIYKDATYITKFYIDASVMELTKEITVIGANGLFEITSDGGYIKKYATNPDKAWETDHDKNVVGLTTAEGSNQIAGQKDIIIICGSVTDNSIQIKEGYGDYKVDITTGPNYPLPIAYMDIYVGDEETDTNGNLVLDAVSYNFLPGTKLEITQNGTMTVESGIKMYFYTTKQCDLDFITNFSYIYSGNPNYTNYRFPTYCVDYDDAVLEVNNSATINGSIAGTITTNSDNSIVTISNTNVSVVYLTYLNYKGGLTMKSPANSNASIRVAEGKIVDNALGTTSSQSTFDTGTYKSIGKVWYKTGNSTIKYIMNDGSGTISEQSFENGKSAELLNPSRTGYTFSAWLDSNKNIYRGSSSVKLYDDISLTAQWELNKYLVTILAEDGTPLNQTEIYYGSVYGDTLPALTKDGYLLKWKIVGTDTYVTEDTPLSLAQDHTIQAEWEKQGTLVEIQFISNGNTISTQMLNAGSTFTTLPTTTRNGYNFLGWFTEDGDGGTQINLGSTIPEVSTKYYAHWDPIIYTITFDANGGECSKASETGSIEQSLTLPTPTRTGYTFTGWYTATSGGTKVGNAGASYTPTANITLHAQWDPLPFTITVTTNNATVKVNGTTVNNNGTVSIPCGTQVTVEVTYSQTENQSTTIKGADGTIYTSPFNMPAQNVTIHATSSAPSSGCIAAGTLITMADGSKKKIELLSNSDMILGFDHETGKLKAVPIAYLDCSAKEILTVIDMVIGDTNVKVINEHGFFDVDLKEYVIININNADDYLGHRFLKVYIDENGEEQQEIVTFTSYSVYQEETRWYSLVAAFTINHLANDILTISDNLIGLYDYFELDNEFKYDAVQKEQDILTYGLFVYDDWKEYLTIEQFYAFNCHYLKVSVGKGILTEDLIFYYINRYVNHDNAI